VLAAVKQHGQVLQYASEELRADQEISPLDNAHFPDRIDTRHALPDKNINLSQLRDNLFRLVSLFCHL
jgi:hypothetical protein|tara:strand:+ start:167 stop:370 length:204 start_codon:yes stop_codon:yes gene_type:complete